ncbi:MAG: PAS domain S-box protein [Candidatus Sulfotelmatobacter sp.]|jgi:PAS domain S-box-containing protein
MRVLIVDDHEVVRRGVRSLILGQSSYEVCGEAVDGQDALKKARQLVPDVIVMDVSMPTLNGLEATHLIRAALPDSEVLILSQHESPEMIRQAAQASARGYVVKSSIARDLLVALDTVSRHQPFFDPTVTQAGQAPPTIDSQEILQRSSALEQALRESEELYRSTFELADLGVAHQSPDGRWLQVNDKVCEIVGYSRDELLKMRFQDITYPDDLEPELRQLEKMTAGLADTYAGEKRYIRKDGSVVWVSLRVSTVRGPDRRVKRFVVVVEDITGRREAKQATYRLAAIVESSDDAIVSKTLNGIIASWNAGAQRIFGFTPKEAVGQPITIIIPAELQDEEKQIIKRLRNGERIEHYETVRMTKSGKRLNISLTVSPVKDSAGRIVGASKIARDITESKRIERALREGEARLRAAFSQTYSFLLLLSSEGTIIEANRAAFEAAGLKREEAIGLKFWELWWSRLPDEAATLKESVTRATRGELVQEECYYCLADGTLRFARRTLSPVLDDAGNLVMIVATGLDITEQKELREKLEARVKLRTQELEEKNAVLLEQAETVRELSGRLLRAQDEERRRIARDLHDSSGQILVAVQLNLTPIEEEARKMNADFAKGIQQSLDLVEQLSKELRTVSYLLHPPLLDEAGLPSALRWYVEGFAERSKINVQLELPTDLGRLPRDMEMTMFRIIQECLTNIHRHSGSKEANIRVARSADEVCLQIQDKGRGMPVSNNGGSTSKLVRAGVGIQGMRERVKRLGGQLEIQSNENGTAVTASFPLVTPVSRWPSVS